MNQNMNNDNEDQHNCGNEQDNVYNNGNDDHIAMYGDARGVLVVIKIVLVVL